MSVFEAEMTFPHPPAEVFDFLARPANLLRISPPKLHMKLIEAPERLTLGSRIVLTVRRFGITRCGISEITAFAEGRLFRDEQREGPFGKWVHTHVIDPIPEGTLVRDHLEYEPPGGLMRWIITERFLTGEIESMWEYRSRQLTVLLTGKTAP
jgi:ligand-binding SRPBCC domain-containing protein